MMGQVLAWTIYATGGVLAALTLVIMLHGAARAVRESRTRAGRRALEPLVLRGIHAGETSLRDAVGGVPSGMRRDVLERILLDHVCRARGVERERVSTALDDLGYVDEYIAGLSARRFWKRAEAAEKLGLARAARAVDALSGAMRDPSSEVRLRAARSLGMLGGTASARELIHALRDTSHWSTLRLADILTGMGRKVVGELLAAFDELPPAGKRAVLEILGRIRPLQAAGWLAARLEDPDPEVRSRACYALGCLGDPHHAEPLLRALTDPEWPVRAMAAKALGKIRHAPAIPALSEALGDREWWVRSNAAQALRAMRRKGREALERMLESPDRYARDQAVLVLQEMGTVDARVRDLAADEPDRREAAVRFIERLVSAGQVERLRALAAEHASEKARAALAELLPPELRPCPEASR